jgi:hypothetical protein
MRNDDDHAEDPFSRRKMLLASPLSIEEERLTTGLRGGLLINFRVRVLRDGLRRIVLT